MVDKLEQSWATFYKEYCQNGGQKKPAGKKYTSGEKTRQEILGSIHGSCSEKPTLRMLHDWKVTALYY